MSSESRNTNFSDLVQKAKVAKAERERLLAELEKIIVTSLSQDIIICINKNTDSTDIDESSVTCNIERLDMHISSDRINIKLVMNEVKKKIETYFDKNCSMFKYNKADISKLLPSGEHHLRITDIIFAFDI